MVRTVKGELTPDLFADLERQRVAVLQQISQLEDFRAGSITGTGGRCGNAGYKNFSKYRSSFFGSFQDFTTCSF
jgi:hypothetical protein